MVAVMTTLRALLVGSIAVLAAGLAFAAPPKDRPCRDDLRRFCSGVESGHDRPTGCLRAHWSELSDRCREAQLPRASAGQLKGCEDDRLRFCHGVKLGGGRLRECFAEHVNELSAGCRAVMVPPHR